MKRELKKLDKALMAINKATIEKKAMWQILSSETLPGIDGYDKLVGAAYFTDYKRKKLLIYEYETRSYYDEDMWHPTQGLRLLIVNDQMQSIWEFPKNRAIIDVYDSVRYQVADVDSFIDDCIEDLTENDSTGNSEL